MLGLALTNNIFSKKKKRKEKTLKNELITWEKIIALNY